MADKEYWQYSLSVSKALNASEAPLKIKHARFIIITTHHHRECNSLWKLLSSQPIMENRFTAWKFCHLLHKVLREGHSSAIQHSQSHKKMLIELGKLWGHLDDLGTCIQSYSKVLVRKLDFHYKNSFFPGSFALSFEDVKKYSGNDINVYFQLCVEMFDYLEDILDLQSCVFASVNSYRMFSMSSSAQCRLAPLITLIQDSNPLYDFCVRIMFKLHDNLQADLLSGHRSRFREIFTKLKAFYDKVRPLQYFEDLIQVPLLPESAPNFTSKVDFGNYIPPVVKVPEPEPEPEPKPQLDNLVDLSQPSASENSSEIEEYKQLLHTKDVVITKFENEMIALRENYNVNKEKYETEINELTKQLNLLSNELILSNELCAKLHKQVSDAPDVNQKNVELEERANNLEEKFNKFKAMYSQIREEHIGLLRQSGESSKLLSQEKKLTQDLRSENELIKEKVNELLLKVETFDEEKKEMQQRLETLSTDVDRYKKDHGELQTKVEHFKVVEASNLNEMTSTRSELLQKSEQFNKATERILCLENEILAIKNNADEKTSNYEDVIKRMQADLNTKTLEIEDLKETHKIELNRENSIHIEIQKKLEEAVRNLQEKELECNQNSEKSQKHAENLQKLLDELQAKCDQALHDKNQIITEKGLSEDKNKQFVQFLLTNLIRISDTTFNTVQQTSPNSPLYMLNEITKSLDLLYGTHSKNYNNEETVTDLLQSILSILNFLTMLQAACNAMYATVTDAEKSEKLWNIMESLKSHINDIFAAIQFRDSCVFVEDSKEIKPKLCELEAILRDISNARDSNEDLADRMKNELADMEKTIAEAAEKFVNMLTLTKSKDDGIKLKVNEKILDACTNLMECIMKLIKRSKALQDEIVSSGRGNVSLREFYNRNSEWTEGLISASKSIAKGANFLVDAANNAVINESSNNLEIIVAAQEIAACTAQLVVASKVKAPKGSVRLQELTTASRGVSQATGAVVAIVKDCVEQIEYQSEIDVLKLTSSQAKAAEMNIQVRVLELEQALQIEREKLASFRKNLYKNAEN